MVEPTSRREETATHSPPGRKLTYEEFLDWCDEDTWAEWEDGETVMISPASQRHQRLKKFLVGIIDPYVETRNLGLVLDAPFQMKTGPDLPGREPDILFVEARHLDRLQQNFLQGPADVVVEIVSPESQERDRGKKFYEYEAGGVAEYWLIDPQRHQAEFYRLVEGFFKVIPLDEEGVYRSQALPGFWLNVNWLWQEPLPRTLAVVARLLGPDLLSRATTEALDDL